MRLATDPATKTVQTHIEIDPAMKASARAAAQTWDVAAPSHASVAFVEARRRAVGGLRQAIHAVPPDDPDRAWLVENARLIRTAEREIKGIGRSLLKAPTVIAGDGSRAPRAWAAACSYLDAAGNQFDERTVEQYLNGIQEIDNLQMGEIWALKPMLQLAILNRLTETLAHTHLATLVPHLLTSLRLVGEAEWKVIFENASAVERALRRDPAGVYARMDYDTRDLYRNALADLKDQSPHSELEIAEKALELARTMGARVAHPVMRESRSHVGYYLIGNGVASLRVACGFRPRPIQRVRDFVVRNAEETYISGLVVATFLAIAALLSGLSTLAPIIAAFLFVLLPATQAAVDFMNQFVTWLLPPRRLPRLDFSSGIPADSATMVAVPTLLLNETQIRELVEDLEVRFLANSDPNLFFALVTDWPDASEASSERDDTVNLCRTLIEKLNERYGTDRRTPFYLFHRHRVYNEAERTWMGWERKRGKLLDLNRLLRGGYDSFPIKVGNPDVFARIRYVITLDSDTQLPRDAAQKLVGTMAHPLNRAVVDPSSNIVTEGYGILQPRIGISVQSASRSRLAALYSGQTGFDIYTRAVSDVYQDLFGEGIFTGKGIYDVDVLRTVLEDRFPENWLLSHDLIEGAYARAGLVTDVEVIDDYPSHFSAYSRRKHRWVRGDWQVLRWILPRVPGRDRRLTPNPINLISRWKLVDNARRSLFDPAMIALFFAGWFHLPGRPWYWTAAGISILLVPAYAQLFFTIVRMRFGRGFAASVREAARAFVKGHVIAVLQLAFLLHQALLSIDAIVRSLIRQFVTRRRLLEWETAAESELTRKKSTVDVYFDWCPWLAVAIAAAVALWMPRALGASAPVLACWFISRPLSAWLNRAPRSGRTGIRTSDEHMLTMTALRTWRFFREFSHAGNHWLIPDSVHEADGTRTERISPTNLGFLLNARVAAVHMGFITVPEFARETRRTLETALKLPRFRGHFLNWYDNHTLAPLPPPFVSTVDSGNLVACLWTLKQAALAFANGASPAHGSEDGVNCVQALLREAGRDEIDWWTAELEARRAAVANASEDVRSDLEWIAQTADDLAQDMDFSFLFHERKKVLSVGYNTEVEKLEPSAYDLLASESRLAAFTAIAKGDVPTNTWFHLGRKHTVVFGRQVLLSWTGTTFEYLMPAIWTKHHRDTLLDRSARSAVAVQKKYAADRKLPWGISESAHGRNADAEYGYGAFGVPDLAAKAARETHIVIAPYATALALPFDAAASTANLNRMAALGWTGAYGFIEAVDYGNGAEPPHPIRWWMAHHQGMILLPVCNLLCGPVLPRHFHAEPAVIATELLLHERVPRGLSVDPEEQPVEVSAFVRAGVAGS